MMNWQEERRVSTDVLFEDIINSALPNESTSELYVPEYMVDFYEETTLTEEWMNTSDQVKRFMLDADIERYMSLNID